MAASVVRVPLAASGSTGNNTHSKARLGDAYVGVGVEFVVEEVGATPTVTWKVQGSIQADETSPEQWYDLAYITDADDTLAVGTIVSTAVGRKVIFLSNPGSRRYKWLRVVTTSNTNVTYRVDAYAFN